MLALWKKILDKNAKFKIDMTVIISKYKNIFEKGYTSHLSEDVFVIKKLKILCRGHMLFMILMWKKLLERFMQKNW